MINIQTFVQIKVQSSTKMKIIYFKHGFSRLLNSKGNILKNAIVSVFHTMKCGWKLQKWQKKHLKNSPYDSCTFIVWKTVCLGEERKSYRCETTCVFVNVEKSVIFACYFWTIFFKLWCSLVEKTVMFWFCFIGGNGDFCGTWYVNKSRFEKFKRSQKT